MTQLYTNNSTRVLSAQHVGLAYGESTRLIDNFSLEIEAGEIVTILGPSGIGKSSLLRVFAGLQQASAGEVFAGKEKLNGAHPRVAMAFQDPSLLPWLNLEQNVAFGLDFTHQPAIGKQERQARIDLAIHEVGLDHARKRFPRELSGGMAQRAALARCIARQPAVLLLDEPFGALDEVTRASMQQLLLKVRDDYGTAAVMITHDIDEALQVSDRIILLGGSPAHIYGQWDIARLNTRDLLDDSMQACRVEILRALRHSIQAQSADNPIEYSFQRQQQHQGLTEKEFSNVH